MENQIPKAISMKNLITFMSNHEVNTGNFLPTKKELKTSVLSLARQMVDSGDHNIQEVYCQAARLKEAATVMEAELRDALNDEDFEAFGVTATYRNGGNTINYKDDPVIKDLEAKIKARKSLIDAVMKTGAEVYDAENGDQVQKVSTTPRKSGLSVSF